MIIEIVNNNNQRLRDELIMKYKPLAHAAVRSVIGNNRHRDYEEIFMQALLALDRAIYDYNIESNAKFSTYAYTNMRNKIINEIRATKAQKRDIGDFNTFEENIGNTSFTYNDILSDKQEDKLKKYDWEVKKNFVKSTLKEPEANIYLKHVEGCSIDELAIENNLDPSKIRNKITYSKRKLKKSKEVYKKETK